MTTLANDISIRVLGDEFTRDYPASVVAGQTIYKGAPVIIDQSVDTTNLVTADGVTCVDGDVFVGIAAGKVTTTTGGAAQRVTVHGYPEIIGIPSTVFTVADLGKTVYVSAFTATGLTLSASNGAYPKIGTLFDVYNGYAWIELVAPAVLDVP